MADLGGRIQVCVHLSHGQDAEEWTRRWRSGELMGINDPSPYGYARAEAFGCQVRFSTRGKEGRLGKIARLGLRALLGFDYLHARRNVDCIFSADIVWTHTESQFLAVALFLLLRSRNQKRPKLLGQSVWLMDKWPRLSPLHRMFYRCLIKRSVSLLTFHSTENLAIAGKIFAQTPCELVLFGIPSEAKQPPVLRSTNPVKVLALGNDQHRDWTTAVKALRGRNGIELTIISETAPLRLIKGASNVHIRRLKSNTELLRCIADATLMLVPLTPNKHASGITVIQEAALHGLPVIATDTGGLRAYFGEDAVHYVPPSDPDAILRAVLLLSGDAQRAVRQAQNAQGRMGSEGLGVHAFVERHVELSAQLLRHEENDNKTPATTVK
jgi:glycosyltransferase involved in cell wall biosynthesis